MNRNHVCYSLNNKIHVFCCFRYSYNPLSCFSLNSYCWCLSSSCTSFFMVYFCLFVDVVFFPLSGFFFSYLFLFISSFCFTAYPFSINCFLFARDFQQLFHNSFIYLSISLLPQIHENQILNMKRAILLATFMLVLHQTKGNAFLSSLFILIKKLL